ncbi:(spotted green pufferfish) hypothetical protein [Aphelenchoides besseyi]|nr:(spotted green pufferfish) hypothetical protein [Aphelenchoides besseyi]
MASYGEASFSGLCRWEHKPKDLIKNSVLYEVPYFGVTLVYSCLRTGDVINEALTNLYVEWNFNRGTMTKSKVDSSKLQKVQLELSIHGVKIRTTGGNVALDPKRIEFCDISETHKQKSSERFLTIVANEDAHNAAYVFMCDSIVATKIKRTVLQLFDMCVMNDLSEKQKQGKPQVSASSQPNGSNDTAKNLLAFRSLVEEFGLKCRAAIKQIEADEQAGSHDLLFNIEKLQEQSKEDRSQLNKSIGAEIRKFEQNLAATLIKAKANISSVEEEMLKKVEQLNQEPISPKSPALWDVHYEKPSETNGSTSHRSLDFFDNINPPAVTAPPVPNRPKKSNGSTTPISLTSSNTVNPFVEFPSNPPSSPRSNGSPLPRRPSIKDKVIGHADAALFGAKKLSNESSSKNTFFSNSLLLEALSEGGEDEQKIAKSKSEAQKS